MHKMFKRYSFGLLMLSTGTFAFAAQTINPLNESDIERGCGCSFHVPFASGYKGDMVLQWEMDSPATMRVDDHVEKLNVVELRKQVLGQRPEQFGDAAIGFGARNLFELGDVGARVGRIFGTWHRRDAHGLSIRHTGDPDIAKVRAFVVPEEGKATTVRRPLRVLRCRADDPRQTVEALDRHCARRFGGLDLVDRANRKRAGECARDQTG